MDRNEISQIFAGKILNGEWHWLEYHFAPYKNGYEHFLCASIVDSCASVEEKLPGYADAFSSKLASLSGREKYLPHYEQIIQLLAELYVIRHLISVPFDNPKFVYEPTTGDSGKNPELGIQLPDKNIYIEVKCREFVEHNNNRGNAAVEVPSRMGGVLELVKTVVDKDESVVLPRDNAVKDFLLSADEKFAPFKNINSDAVTVLVIVWDDFVYEPISALLNEASGLLTGKSFYTENGGPVAFSNINAILVTRHSHQLVRATKDEFPVDGIKDPLDWGAEGNVLPKAYIPVNSSGELDKYLCDLLQARHIDELQNAADYRPQQFVLRI